VVWHNAYISSRTQPVPHLQKESPLAVQELQQTLSVNKARSVFRISSRNKWFSVLQQCKQEESSQVTKILPWHEGGVIRLEEG
jgi:hypothetical protein